MKGRKPKPTKLHLLQGGKRKTHRPANDNEPLPAGEAMPKCPAHLDKDAKKEWRRMSRELHRIGLLTTLDKTVFAIYCQAWSTWVSSVKKIADEGPIIDSPSGYPIQNPYLAVKNKAEDQMMKSLTELGMSPSSRTRIKVPPAKEKNEVDEFLEGNKAKK